MRESVPFDVPRPRSASALRAAFVAASVAWAVILALAPYVASRPHASPAGTAFVVAVYGIGSLICHQRPERSYRLWTAQMPVCARCAGIYFGAALAALAAVAQLKRRPTYAAVVRHRFSGANTPRATLIIAALPTLLTLVYEWTTGQMPAHWIRAGAGALIGVAVAWLVIQHAHDARPVHPEPIEG